VASATAGSGIAVEIFKPRSSGGFGNDQKPARDFSGQTDARGSHLDDAGLAGLAHAEDAVIREAQRP
jgi:hypothetical protein